MAFLLDTIVAPITGLAPAAVAGIRISGPEAWKVAAAVFPRWPADAEPLKAVYGRFVHGDDGFVLPFEAGRSFTGETSAELFVHGSPESVRQIVAACRQAGARTAEPGEFTLRAFLNGRIDLTQAEAVRDTVESRTAVQLRAANAAREGALREAVEAISDRIVRLLAAIEASVDFGEEVGELDRPQARADLLDAAANLGSLLDQARVGRIVRQGLRIAIVGRPNAGKSSLLNALLRSERAIVTDVPGTTRDTVEESAAFDGVPVVLIDTAGLRDSADPVESLGIQRSRASAADADLIWYVYDAAAGWTDEDAAFLASFDRPAAVVANKADLPHSAGTGRLVSAKTGLGLPQLASEAVRDAAPSDLPLVNDRHAALLREAREAVEAALSGLSHDAPEDLLTTHLRQALHSLGRITGETVEADMLERIFRDFCVGK